MIRPVVPDEGETPLHIDYEHPRSSYGAGVVVDEGGGVFDGAQFRSPRA